MQATAVPLASPPKSVPEHPIRTSVVQWWECQVPPYRRHCCDGYARVQDGRIVSLHLVRPQIRPEVRAALVAILEGRPIAGRVIWRSCGRRDSAKAERIILPDLIVRRSRQK